MAADPFDISIVILTWNRKESVRELLAGLAEVAPVVQDVIVVDNASVDGTAEMMAAEFPDYLCITTERNEGVSARNHGVFAARGRIVVTLDDDLLGLSREHLALLEERFAADERLAALNFHVIDHFTERTCNWVHHRPAGHAPDRFLTYEITEGAVAVRRDVFTASGGYCADFFISHEGPDLAYRLMNAGGRVEYDGRITLRHKHAEASRVSWRFYYYDTRNHIWLAVRNMPWGPALRYLVRSLGAMAVYALRDGQFVYWAQAVRDGMNALPAMLATREAWTTETRDLCREADSHRPGFWTLVRERLRGGSARMDA